MGFSRCLGCSSTFYPMASDPRAFEGVCCLVGPQPVTMARRLVMADVPVDRIDETDKKLQWIRGTNRRFDGYLEFRRRPQPMLQPMLQWFESHMES
jgi:uncharacterized protein